MTEKLLVDVDGAGQLLTMTRRTVERMTASGELPSVRVGALRRYRVSDLEEFVGNLGENNGAASPVKLTALAGDQVRRGRRRR